MLVCSLVELTSERSRTPESLLQFLLREAALVDDVSAFLEREPCDTKGRKVVSVEQGECARVDLAREPYVIVASDNATTCLIAVAVCRLTQLATVAHFDDATNGDGHFANWLHGLKRPEIFLVGDYVEPSRQASLSSAFLWFLHQCDEIDAELKLLCVRELNTAESGFPRTYALGYDCERQVAFANFRDFQPPPALTERSVARMSRGRSAGLENVYETAKQRLHVRGFCVRSKPFARAYLQLTDEELLEISSTSPHHEPPSFAKNLRVCWEWISGLSSTELTQPDRWFDWTPELGWRES